MRGQERGVEARGALGSGFVAAGMGVPTRPPLAISVGKRLIDLGAAGSIGRVVGGGNQPAEVGVTGRGFGQQREVGLVLQGQLGPRDRRDAGRVGELSELHRAVDAVVVRDREVPVTQIRRPPDHLLRERGAVQKREGGVQMQFGVGRSGGHAQSAAARGGKPCGGDGDTHPRHETWLLMEEGCRAMKPDHRGDHDGFTSVGLGMPGILDAVMVDGADISVLQRQPEVAAANRMPPPFVLDAPDVGHMGDLATAALLDQGHWESALPPRLDANRAGQVQGS